MSAAATERPLTERALEVLRRSGNPFRNYFARNPDDEVCARYHVPELFASERDLLLSVVDLYRYDPTTHSEVVPVLGNKGAGKTHLLHSIKHGGDGAWQLLVTPGVYQKDSEFLEYLLFQIIDTLLGGGQQRGVRPLEYVGEQLARRLLGFALRDLTPEQRLELFPPPGLGRWTRRLGLGQSQAQERSQWLAENLSGYANLSRMPMPVGQALQEAGLTPEQALDLIAAYVERTEAHNTAGLMRRAVHMGFARAALLKDESELASFLTYGFAELEFHVRPTRQDLVLASFKVLMEVFRSLKTPVVVAFDQLEDLLLARRSDDAHRIAEAFFAGIVQVMHQIDGLCFLIFAERGLWNRFVPSLDGYIQDRLNNPVHVPRHGTVKALRLEAPAPELVRRVVEARLRPGLEELPDCGELSEIFPFTDEQVTRIARTEPTLRDMLQQFRHLFDHVVYGPENDSRMASFSNPSGEARSTKPEPRTPAPERPRPAGAEMAAAPAPADLPPVFPMNRAFTPPPSPLPEPPAMPPVPLAEEVADEEPEAPLPAEGPSPVIPFPTLPPLPESLAARSAPAFEVPLPKRTDASADVPPVPPPALTPELLNNRIAPLAIDPPPPLPPVRSVFVVESPADQLPPEPPAPAADESRAEPLFPPAPSPRAFEMPDLPAVPPPAPAPAAFVPPPVPRTPSPEPRTPVRSSSLSPAALLELWEQEQRSARRKLEPEGALTGAARELQAGLGAFLQTCHEHGVKVGPWRLQHVVGEYTFGEHPTYGAVTIAHWACKDGQPWKVGIGLFLARAAGKPRDLEVKLSVMEQEPAIIDHLILLRPEDDLTLSGKSKTLWSEAERRNRHARIEPVSLDGFATLYSFPRWLAALTEALPDGQPLPNLADLIQEHCEKLLEQVCMPVQG